MGFRRFATWISSSIPSSSTRDLLGDGGRGASMLAWRGLKRSSRSSLTSGTFSRLLVSLVLAAAG